MLTGVVCSLYEGLIHFIEWGVENLTYGITFMVFFFKVTFLSHTVTNEARSSRTEMRKLLVEGNWRN
jgi:hypothetical protein